MIKINGSPETKQKVLKATVGIDSIHVLIKMNRFDLKRFCIYKGYPYKEIIVKSDHQRKWYLFLQDGEPVTATYHFKSKTMKLEIGELLNYSIKRAPHKFTQELFSYFSDREISIGRLDVAVDINMKRDDLIVKNLSKIISTKRVKSTTYNNAAGHVLVAYDKSAELKIYSTDLTRLELRLNTQLSNWKVTDFTSNRKYYEKLVTKVEEYFSDKAEVYSNDGLTRYLMNLDMSSVLWDFIAFVHGDRYKYKDYFRIKEAVEKRDTIFRWMEANKLTPKKINRFVKGRRAAFCKDLGLDSKSFKKAVDFYKAIPDFKF